MNRSAKEGNSTDSHFPDNDGKSNHPDPWIGKREGVNLANKQTITKTERQLSENQGIFIGQLKGSDTANFLGSEGLLCL